MKPLSIMKIIVVVLAVIIVILLGVFFFYNPALPSSQRSRAIISADGHLAVSAPQEDAIIASPLTITGTVTDGGWFFEGSFPVNIIDNDGRILGAGIAEAQSDWMATSSVSFTAIVNFIAPLYDSGTIVLKKDNPSGVAANDASLSIHIRFK